MLALDSSVVTKDQDPLMFQGSATQQSFENSQPDTRDLSVNKRVSKNNGVKALVDYENVSNTAVSNTAKKTSNVVNMIFGVFLLAGIGMSLYGGVQGDNIIGLVGGGSIAVLLIGLAIKNCRCQKSLKPIYTYKKRFLELFPF